LKWIRRKIEGTGDKFSAGNQIGRVNEQASTVCSNRKEVGQK